MNGSKFELFYPLKPFVVSQKFGENAVNYKQLLGLVGHPGWDMVGSWGQNIYAAHDGFVASIEIDDRGGLGVVLVSNDAYDYNSQQVHFKTIYWHCLTGSIKVKAGQQVKRGDLLAQCDSTGIIKGQTPVQESHLHFGIKPSVQLPDDVGGYWNNLLQDNGYGGAIDPEPFWNGKYYDYTEPPVSVVVPGVETPIIVSNVLPSDKVVQEISIIQQLISLYYKLINAIKGR